MADLMQYVPQYLEESSEIQAIMDAEKYVFESIIEAETAIVKANQFVITANEYGIKDAETILRITADPLTEDLEFRRQRILNRYATRPPFTMPFLRQRFNEIIGAGAYTIIMDYQNNILTLESSAIDQLWYEEIIFTVNLIKPATVVFKNKPLVQDKVKMSEAIAAATQLYNYRAGTTARASYTVPIASRQSIGTIKGAEVMSITSAFLSRMALFACEWTEKVLINDTYETDVFITKSNTDNTAIIEYNVPIDAGISTITKINFKSGSGEILTKNSVYVLTGGEDVVVKHTIPIKEGA